MQQTVLASINFEKKIMMSEKIDVLYCLSCGNLIESCFCSCPYCGAESCSCHLEFFESNKNFLTTVYSNSVKKQSNVIDKEDVWWRLEKWQIGRKNFP